VPLLLPIHVVTAGVGLVSGAIALTAAKGRTVHRRSGIVFVYAIVAMCASAAVAAVVRDQAVNVIAALLTAYLVLTGLMTVRPPSESRSRDVGLMMLALVVGLATFAIGFAAVASPSGKVFGYPPYPFFLFGVLGLSASAGDFRIIRSGPRRGAPRLRRHLWRMCMALFIAAASFFSIRARVAVSSLPRSQAARRGRCPCCWCWWRCSTGCGASARESFPCEPESVCFTSRSGLRHVFGRREESRAPRVLPAGGAATSLR
jgi:uncharacterized membrane protein